MRVHAVDKLTSFIGSKRLSAFHYDMFHGEIRRCGVKYPHEPDATLENTLREPLEVSRNVRSVPDLFCPSRNFVVSRALRQKIEGVRNIEFLAVKIVKFIDYPYAPADFSFYDDPICVDPEELFELLPDVPEFHERIGPYYEVLTAGTKDVAGQYESLKPISVYIGPSEYDERVEERLSEQMMTDYPILRGEWAMLLNDAVFQLIKDDIDWEFFLHADVEL